MKRKTAWNKVKSGLVCILAGIILFAGSGFAYHVHFCHGSRASESFYPGLFQKAAGCGCESGSISLKAESQGLNKSAISKSGCCKNFKFFQKVPTITFSDVLSKIKFVDAVAVGFHAISTERMQKRLLISPILLSLHPPPISGKSLVFRFHQIRIPSFPGDC